MNHLTLLIAVLMQLLFLGGVSSGEDLNSKHAYKVTSYDLGAINSFLNRHIKPSVNTFTPLFITETTANTIDSEHHISVSLGDTTPDILSLNSVALSAQFDATESISIQGALGMTRNLWTPELYDSLNGSSWEANLGIIYKLLNNLSYELHFGYMDTGHLFDQQNGYTDVENIIMINNKLTLSF